MEKIQNKREVWLQVAFFISAILFVIVLVGVQEFTWLSAVVLATIVLFHEAGHYIGMRLFDYQGVHMFFIPFLGAITVGHKKFVVDWQHAIVVLLGPLPGIFAGLLLYIVYATGLIRSPFIVETTLILLALNGFNLLPVLPLDGGQIVHHIIFAKHPFTELIFPILSLCLFAFLAFILRNWVFLILIVSPLFGIAYWFDKAKKRTEMRKLVEKLDVPAHFHNVIVEAILSLQGTVNEVELQEAITRIVNQKRLQSAIRNLGLLSLYIGAIALSIGVAIYLVRDAFTQLQLDANQQFEIMSERALSLDASAEGYSKCEQAQLLQASNAQNEIVYNQKRIKGSLKEDEDTMKLIEGYKVISESSMGAAQGCKANARLATESAKLYVEAANNALNLTRRSASINNTPQSLFILLRNYENDKRLSKYKIAQKESEFKASQTVVGLYSDITSSLNEILKNVQKTAEFLEKASEDKKVSHARLSALYARQADAYQRKAYAIKQNIALVADKTHFESIKEKISESDQSLWQTIYNFREAQINIEQATAEIEIVHIEEDIRELFPPSQESN